MDAGSTGHAWDAVTEMLRVSVGGIHDKSRAALRSYERRTAI
jgi:hypothetical protein